MSYYLVVAFPPEGILDVKGFGGRQIANTATTDTADMIMLLSAAVKSFLTTAKLQFLYHATFRQNIQVAINGAQTDVGQPPPNHLVNLAGGRVGIDFVDLLQDDLALASHPEFSVLGQPGLLIRNSNHSYITLITSIGSPVNSFFTILENLRFSFQIGCGLNPT